jgi:hypothetical protein
MSRNSAKEVASEIQILKKLGPRSTPQDYERAAKKPARKKVSSGSPKFLGRTPANEKWQQSFPSRDPKFMGRTKNTSRKMVAK